MTRISLGRVSKRYLRGRISDYILHQFSPRKHPDDWFWALRNIDLSIPAGGASLGIIGVNGSGKSTLLKIITGVTKPTGGVVETRGRISPLLELGEGLELELTGRENLFLAGVMLGMRRAEVKRKLPSIVAMAGVERFLDMPLKHYSTGMAMRLSFSVAIHRDAEIILMDEVWSIGDVGFQGKSLEKIKQLQKQGVTTVIVTHDVAIVRELTDRTLWLKSGRIAALGETEAVIQKYLKTSQPG